MSAKDIIKKLKRGNERFVSLKYHDVVANARSQSPDVAVLTCADSRVPPELIFSKGIGDLFVVRVAGNVAFEPSVIESLEYSVAHLGVKVILVLGHTRCGAVGATLNGAKSPLMDEIRAGFRSQVKPEVANLTRQLEMLPERSPVIAKAVADGEVVLAGAMYDLETGAVEFLE